jgi:hypothetical protein
VKQGSFEIETLEANYFGVPLLLTWGYPASLIGGTTLK